jgi:hypothetical protein
MNSGIINQDGNRAVNSSVQTLPWNKSGNNSSFPSCSSKDTICPFNSDSYVCVGGCASCAGANQFVHTGQVVEKRYGCNPYDNYKCELVGVDGQYSNLDFCST